MAIAGQKEGREEMSEEELREIEARLKAGTLDWGLYIPILVAEVRRLRTALTNAQAEHKEEMRYRDDMEDMKT